MLFNRSAALLEACVLSVLERGDTYGYELTSRIKTLQDVSESTLYPVLKRLQKENLLATYDEAVSGRNRRYYSITETGRRKLFDFKKEWEGFKKTIDEALYPGSGGVYEQN